MSVRCPYDVRRSLELAVKEEKREVSYCKLLDQLHDDRFRDAVANNPHLHRYLHMICNEGIELPQFKVQLSRDLAYVARPNVLYPVGDPVFVHVMYREGDLSMYIPIEPELPSEYSDVLIEYVDRLLVASIDEKVKLETVDEKREFLEKVITEHIELTDDIDEERKNIAKLRKDLTKKNFKTTSWRRYKLRLTKETLNSLLYVAYRERIGFSILEPFIRDPYLEDISCPGVGPIFVVHKVFGSLKSTIEFKDQESLDRFILQLAEKIGKRVTRKRPIVDGTLPDGSRVNIVYGVDVSKRGSNFTIRKFSAKPLSITQLIKLGTLSPEIAAYLWICIEHGMNIFICGETASGKTTTLNAIAAFIPPHAKVVSIEDTPEVVLPHENWVREVARESIAEKEGTVDLFELLRAALRQRPNYIIVGEIRGREAYVAFQAMQTGHAVLTTFHAASVEKLIQRLIGKPMNVPRTFIDNLNVAVFQSIVYDKSHVLKRKVMSVCEIVGYDPINREFHYIELFHWDPVDDVFEFRKGSSYILEEKVAPKLKIPRNKLTKVYEILEERANFLRELINHRIYDYEEVWRAIRSYYLSGDYEEALRYVESMRENRA